ncbi:hypothetical protein ANN_26632 [Periplaneta americana]|uniref:Uncharacterized protein n=1 Tax=Periplaneta americana TaxID=6978 RepID=A0ABQ8RYR2_PERAM|nr:hypothetical protein ANN_26632 [Periplaneta americana]
MTNARLIPFEDLSLVTILPIMHVRYLSDYAMNYLALERKRPMQTSGVYPSRENRNHLFMELKIVVLVELLELSTRGILGKTPGDTFGHIHFEKKNSSQQFAIVPKIATVVHGVVVVTLVSVHYIVSHSSDESHGSEKDNLCCNCYVTAFTTSYRTHRLSANPSTFLGFKIPYIPFHKLKDFDDEERLSLYFRILKYQFLEIVAVKLEKSNTQLRREESNIARIAFEWNPHGANRKVGRPKVTWSNTVRREAEQLGWHWNEVKQRIPNLTGPVDNNDITLQRNRNKTAGRIDGCHGDCISCCLCYASKILRNFRTAISFKEKRA